MAAARRRRIPLTTAARLSLVSQLHSTAPKQSSAVHLSLAARRKAAADRPTRAGWKQTLDVLLKQTTAAPPTLVVQLTTTLIDLTQTAAAA